MGDKLRFGPRLLDAHWFVSAVLWPFILTRLVLVAAAYFARALPTNMRLNAPEITARGWWFTPTLPLDIWFRYDSGWYNSIIQNGYFYPGSPGIQSNIAFFPLYPFLVKMLLLFSPSRDPNAVIGAGIAVSNVCLLLGLSLAYLWIRKLSADAIARRTIWYLLLFPTGFYFSCFYSESTFLVGLGAGLYFIGKRKWWAAGIAVAWMSLTRPLGILGVIPLLLSYMAGRQWNFRRIRADLFWVLLPPAVLGAYLLIQAKITGDFLAPLKAQSGWSRTFSFPWEPFFSGAEAARYMASFDRFSIVLMLVLSICVWRVLKSPGWALFCLGIILISLSSGSMASITRYESILVPAFGALAIVVSRPWVDRGIRLVFFAVQIAFWMGFCRFYFVA